MALPTKTRYTLQDAAAYIADLTGETVAVSDVLDWISQGILLAEVPIEDGVMLTPTPVKPEVTMSIIARTAYRSQCPDWFRFGEMLTIDIPQSHVQLLLAGRRVTARSGLVNGEPVYAASDQPWGSVTYGVDDISISARSLSALTASHGIFQPSPTPSSQEVAWSVTAPEKSDPLADMLYRALKAFSGNPTPPKTTEVIAYLEKNKDGTDFIRPTNGGIEWYDGNGDSRHTAKSEVSRRIKRMIGQSAKR